MQLDQQSISSGKSCRSKVSVPFAGGSARALRLQRVLGASRMILSSLKESFPQSLLNLQKVQLLI
jgi:hypothetical protein